MRWRRPTNRKAASNSTAPRVGPRQTAGALARRIRAAIRAQSSGAHEFLPSAY
jgi:hypothetical protein